MLNDITVLKFIAIFGFARGACGVGVYLNSTKGRFFHARVIVNHEVKSGNSQS